MSIFDLDNGDKVADFYLENLKDRHSIKPITGYDGLSSSDFNDIKNLINLVDLLPSELDYEDGRQNINCLKGLIPAFEIRRRICVEISPLTPFLSDLHDEIDSGSTLLLGVYCSADKKIILYINNIKESGNDNWKQLLIAVYIHELYHAYFNSSEYVPKVEEPLAEMGAIYTLACMESIGIFNEGIYKYYHKKVLMKTGSICFYGFGAKLYEYSDLSQIGQMLENFKTDSKTILSKKDDIKIYEELLKSIDLVPMDEESCKATMDAYETFCRLCGIKIDLVE